MRCASVGRGVSPTMTAPVGADAPRPTEAQRIDEAVGRLWDNAARFAHLSLDQRVALARAMQVGYVRVAEASVRAACAAKGISLGTPLEGEEWCLGPWIVVRHLRLIQQSLLALKRTGNTSVGKVGRTVDDRLSVQVYPANGIDAMLFNGVRVDVHLQRGVTEKDLHATRAGFYKVPSHDGRVALVLGAGNVNAIVSLDLITKMFNEGKVCAVKMNPVNAYLGPYLEQGIHRVHLHRAHLPFVEHLGNQVEGHDGVHVAGAEDERDASVMTRHLVEPRARGVQVLFGDTTLKMHVHADAVEQHRVDPVGRVDLHRQPVVDGSPHLADGRVSRSLEREQRLLNETQVAHDNPRPQAPLFPFERGPERDPLCGTGSPDARLGNPDVADLHRACKRDPLVKGQVGESRCVVPQPADGLVDALRLGGTRGVSSDWCCHGW